jgi:hypothetical protein
VPQEAAEWVLQQAGDLRARFAAIQPVLERGEVTGLDAIVRSLMRQGCVIDGRTPAP